MQPSQDGVRGPGAAAEPRAAHLVADASGKYLRQCICAATGLSVSGGRHKLQTCLDRDCPTCAEPGAICFHASGAAFREDMCSCCKAHCHETGRCLLFTASAIATLRLFTCAAADDAMSLTAYFLLVDVQYAGELSVTIAEGEGRC